MKYKTTKKEVMQGYDNVICVGYADLQSLLACEKETAYTTRAEGWAADIYDFGNAAIVTGYSPFGNVHPNYEICQKYEKAAKKVYCNYDLPYAEKKERLQDLIKEFIEEITK